MMKMLKSSWQFSQLHINSNVYKVGYLETKTCCEISFLSAFFAHLLTENTAARCASSLKAYSRSRF